MSTDCTIDPAADIGHLHLKVADLDRALAFWRQAPVSIGPPDHGASQALYLHDPDNNGAELCWDRPREDWPRRDDGSLVLGTEPLDVEELLRTSRG